MRNNGNDIRKSLDENFCMRLKFLGALLHFIVLFWKTKYWLCYHYLRNSIENETNAITSDICIKFCGIVWMLEIR